MSVGAFSRVLAPVDYIGAGGRVSASVEGYRLTAADESAVTARVREAVTLWASPGSAGSAGGRSLVQVTAADRLALQRIGAHAIGCGFADLRDVELDWIEETVLLVAADDWARAARELTIGGKIWTAESDGGVFVFGSE